MSVFVDTGVFYAHHDTDASRHGTGTAALNAVLRSPEYGHVMTSDYIYSARAEHALVRRVIAGVRLVRGPIGGREPMR
ncbi:hypothetical protein [Halorubrum sp. SY-15]|jgi:predicted nucleic acid-binding protein|uniref:hypothetical protein n=1 Tax=Halorubrum sp. SY-15 TaxID=3402277 RepID=UPI003EBC6863